MRFGLNYVWIIGVNWRNNFYGIIFMEYVLNNGEKLKLNTLAYWGQVAVKIGNNWIGNLKYKNHIINRLDKTLPTNMNDMTVIDLGASDGLFCYEAAYRGAKHVVGIEHSKSNYENIESIKNYFNLPITVVNKSIDKLKEEDLLDYNKYSLGLVLNVLYVVARNGIDPQKTLEKILSVSNKIIVETPWHNNGDYVIEKEPWSFPPSWMERLAENFDLDVSHKKSPHEPLGRRMYIFEKKEH
jgi:hypothetical protein